MQIVSLTTDFGNQDYYVAELKASILHKQSDVQIIDISHQIDYHDIVQAAYFLENTYKRFPEGTIHIVAVYSYFSAENEFIAFQRDGHFFVGPNNGVFSLLFEQLKPDKVFAIDKSKIKDQTLSGMLSHCVGCISHGLPLSELGAHSEHVVERIGIKPVVTGSQIRATIIHIDHNENVVINVTKDYFEKVRNERSFSLYYKQNDPITKISNHYSEADIGEVVCIFNDAGYLEIAINAGRAASLLNLRKNETIQINFN